MSCPFCAIVAGSERASVVHEDEAVVALCDLQPVNPGHLLVIPKAHADGLADLAPADGARMFAVAQRLAAALRATDLRCDGVDIFLTDSAAAGQGRTRNSESLSKSAVFHAHLHVIPRHPGDDFRIHTGRPTVAPRAELDDVARAVRAALPDLAPPDVPVPSDVPDMPVPPDAIGVPVSPAASATSAAPPAAALPPLVDPAAAADSTTAWTALITRYYDGCSTGDVDLILTTLHPDVVHWFLAPNTGSTAVAGAEHLARYWRKVAGMLQARWVVDSAIHPAT